ncbi:somatostatin receptor type 2-like [Branchiostoma lanceolatum]|uniref:somatostatin receptor type 2-like n=1 Tax=Branchiostoma lanceolatum TaxID=7740 RepID=UPI0034533AD9
MASYPVIPLPKVTVNETVTRYDLIDTLDAPTWYTVIHLILAAMGAVANALVIYILLRKPKMRTYPNIFVFSLALSDFVFCAVAIPLSWMVFWLDGFNGWLAHVSFVSYDTCTLVGALCLMTMSIERYQAVSNPIRHVQRCQSVRRGLLAIAGFWVGSILVSILFYVFVMLPGDQQDVRSADLRNRTLAAKLYSFIVMFAVPLLVTVIFYILLFKALKQRGDIPARARSEARSHGRVTRMVTAVVVAYVVSWSPAHIIGLVAVSGSNITVLALALRVCFVLQVINAVTNPFLYALLGEKFGFYIREMMCRKNPGKQQHRDGEPTTIQGHKQRQGGTSSMADSQAL